MSTTRRQKQRAHRYLFEVYRETVDRMTAAVLAQDLDVSGATFDYGWEELQDRYAMRVQHLQVLLGALEGAARPLTRTKRWVRTLLVSPDELESALNERLAEEVEDDGEIEDVSMLPAADDQVCVVLRYRACVPLRERAPAG